MTKEISNKTRVQVLFEAGFQKPKTISKRTGIPKRSVHRYIATLKEAGTLDRKPYFRKPTKVTPVVVKKVLQKVTAKRRVSSARSIGASIGLHHSIVSNILKDHNYNFKRRTKKASFKRREEEKQVKMGS